MTFHRLLLTLALLCLPGVAQAQTRLLVLSPVEETPRPTLVEALRLHLRGTAQVQVSTALFPALPAASRVALATELVSTLHVEFAIWLESVALGDGTRLFALYVVGGKPGRAVLEVVRLPAESDTPDVDRTLALKASEIVEAALSPAAMLLPAPRPSAERVLPRAAAKSPPARERHLGLELGGALRGAAESDTQAGLTLGASLLALTQPLEIDARLVGQFLTANVIASPRRRVSVAETLVGAGFGARSSGTVQLGIRLGFGVRLLRAEGFSEEARTGSARLAVPSLSGGPELRLRLSPRISFAAQVAGEWLMVRQSFDVDGVTVADLGRFRESAELSLIFFVL
jgi:hypothetical protein